MMSQNSDGKRTLMVALVAFMLVSGVAVGAVVVWEALRLEGSVTINEPATDSPAWSVDGITVLWFDDILAGQETPPIDVVITNVSDTPRALSATLETTNPNLSLKVYNAAGGAFSSQVVNPGDSVTVKLAILASPTATATTSWFTVVFPA